MPRAALAALVCAFGAVPAAPAAAASADLTITSLTGASGAAVGETATLTDTVQNQGTGAAGYFNVVYYLSDNQDLGSADYLEYQGSRVVGGLVAGESDSGSLAFTVPAVATGTYYVIAVADGFSGIDEASEANNSSSKAFSVTASGGAGTPGQDLSVTTVTAPASAGAGGTITIHDSVANVGDASAGASYVYYYLSSDDAYSGSDTMLGLRNVPSLSPGASSNGSASVTVPYVAQGGYYVIAVVSASETDLDNNTLATGAPMTVVNDVDLTVTAAASPGSVSANQTAVVSDTVRNNGTTSAGTFKVGYYLSTDGVYSEGSDTLLGYRVVASLSGGTSGSGSASVTVPSVGQGDYYVIAVADPQGAAAETDEANNALPTASPMAVANALDLVVTSVTAPASAVVGRPITLSDAVRNIGAQSTGTFRVGYYLSPDGSYSESDVLLGYRTIGSLSGESNDSGSITVTMPSSASPGSYTVVAVADPLHTVSETGESNNSLAAGSPTSVTSGPDLAVTTVTAPASASVGETISVHDEAADYGTNPVGAFTVDYFLSADGVYSSSDTLLGRREVASLSGGSSDAGSASVTVPTSAAPGTYTVIAVADSRGAVSETDEGNNALAAAPSITLTADPDLVLSTLTVPSAAVIGAAMAVVYAVQNAGYGGAEDFGLSFYLSTDDVLSYGADVFLGSRTIAGLDPAGVSRGTAIVTVPAVLHGRYYVIAAADPADAVAEMDEGDNTLASGRSVDIQLPPLGTAGTPGGYALGVSSIAWGWSAAQNAERYLVFSASAPAAPMAEVVMAQTVQGGLTPNAAGSIRVVPANADGPGAGTEYSAPVYTLAEPPGGTAVSGVAVTSASVSWGLGSNPAGTLAEVERAADGEGFTPVFSGAAVELTEDGLLACTSYWYRVRNRNGDGVATAYDSAAWFRTGASTPAAPNYLTASSLTDSRISLSWEPSVSEGVVGYRLYYDNGAGTVDYGTPLAVFSSTQTRWTTGALAPRAAYVFGLRAFNRCGVEEPDAGVTAFAGAQSGFTGVRAAVTSPQSGQKVWGSRVTVAAGLVSGDPSQTRQVLFQYRLAGAAGWTDIAAALAVPYFVDWDVLPLGAGVYELRAVAEGFSGGADASAPGISVSVDPAGYDIVETPSQKEQKLNNSIANTVEAGDPTSMFFVKLDIPSGALSSTTATVTVVSNPVSRPAPPQGVEDLGLMVQVGLSNGQTWFSGGRTATITLSYPDANGDGIVDGGTGRVDRLKMYTAETAAGPWTRVAAAIDSGAKTVSGVASHFSFFALFTAAADDLRSVRVYPNPFKPNSGDADDGVAFSPGDPNSGIIFDNLPGSVEIRIFTLTGRLAARIGSASSGGKLRWDVKNEKGRDAASGLYFAVITGPGQTRVVKKLLIAR